MAVGVHRITEDFERAVSEYTRAPYVIAVDNQSNALFLSLIYENIRGKTITIPNRTYPSVPAEILRAGGNVGWRMVEGKTLKGEYQLEGSRVWDSALTFTHNMFRPQMIQCVSFTGPYKILKLSKGGAILTDDYHAHLWFKKARFSGRNECSYHTDFFTMIGINCYMMPEIAMRGLLLMSSFYDFEGKPKVNESIEVPYPDLSTFPIYNMDPDKDDIWGINR